MKAPVGLWLTDDRADVVREGDPRSAFQLAAEGCEIPEDEARKVGWDKIHAALEPGEKQAKDFEDKQVAKEADKSVAPEGSGLAIERKTTRSRSKAKN